MKKLFALILSVCMMVVLTACNTPNKSSKKNPSSAKDEPVETVTLQAGTEYTMEDYASFTLFKVHTTKQIFASMGGSSYYENDKDGETYVDIIFDWTNISTSNMDISDLVTVRAINQKGAEYTRVFYSIETQNATNLSQTVELSPHATARLHCALSIPDTETDLTLKVRIKNHEYVCDYSLGTIMSTAKPLAMDEVVEATDHATLVMKNIEYTDDVCPSNTDTGYSHYTIDDITNTYLVLKFDITNQESTAKDIDSFVHITALYMEKYSYKGFTVVEDEDGKGFSPYEDIAPLTTRHFYHLIEVPKTITENEVTLTLVFDGKEYTCII